MSLLDFPLIVGMAAGLAQAGGILPAPPAAPEPPIGVNVPAIHASCKLLTATGEVIDAEIDTAAYFKSDSNGSWKNFSIRSSKKMPFSSNLSGGMRYENFDDGIASFSILAAAEMLGGDDYYISFTAYRHSEAVMFIDRIEQIKVDESQSNGRNHYYASGYCRSSYNMERK